jgi:cytochrome c oxidase assembly protein subunit 15
MAGLRAAVTAPTWPDINGSMIPPGIFELSPFGKNLVANPITIHFIHRGLAYLLVILIGIWWLKSRSIVHKKIFSRLRFALMLLVLLQVLLGISTVLYATYPNRLVLSGVSHQFVAMVLLMLVVSLVFIVRKKQLG